VQMVDSSDGLSASELCNSFAVSRMTINRDLLQLKKQQLVRRIHGCVLVGNPVAAQSAQQCAYCGQVPVVHQSARLLVAGEALVYCCC